jgi:hypothetical protein
MKKKIPAFKSDRAAAAFVDKADLTQYDLSGAQLMRFEIKRKDKSINLRLSEDLCNAQGRLWPCGELLPYELLNTAQGRSIVILLGWDFVPQTCRANCCLLNTLHC